MPIDGEPIRFVDLLTMASAVANYLGAPEVTPAHVVDALDVLEGRAAIEDLGRALSPLVPRAPGGPAVDVNVREFAQRWVSRAGNDPACPLGPERLELLRAEVVRLAGDA